MRWLRSAALLAALAAAGCDDKASPKPPPQEVTSNSIGQFCGMALPEHGGPKAQIFNKGRAEPYWFSSVHNMFAFTFLQEELHDFTALYVNDMGRAHDWAHPEAGTWIDAHDALYVIASNRRSGMNEAEAVPFGTETAAQAFVAQHGGRLVRFSTMPRDYILPGEQP